ncbi:MAG: hypothetical protein WBO37_07770 [Gammaproteobacteria bacterium]
MADLFSVTAPLLIRYPDGRRHIMLERFAYGPGRSLDPGHARNNGPASPAGLVYFRPFWDRLGEEGICLVQGELRGDGPWKVGAAVITVLGCHGSDPVEAAEYASWLLHREQLADNYPDRETLRDMARSAGYLP